VVASTVVSAGALFAVVQIPGVSQFFGCTPLGPVGWGIATGSAAAATAGSVVLPWGMDRLRRRRPAQVAEHEMSGAADVDTASWEGRVLGPAPFEPVFSPS